MSYSEVRQNLAKVMSPVCDCHESLIITRPNAPSVVLMSREEYNSILETLYLLHSPANVPACGSALTQQGLQHPRCTPLRTSKAGYQQG